MNRRLSRRSLLESGSLAIGVLIASGAISRTVADEEISEADKIKQMDAHYQRYPKGSAALPDLSAIRPPDKCKIVQGPIFPQGWCQFFAARENAR